MKSVGGANKIYDAILAQDLGDPHLFLVFSLSYGIGRAGLGRLEGTGWEVLSQGSPRRGCPGVRLGAAVGGFSHPSCLQRGYTPASRGGQSSGSSALLPVW